MSSRPKWFRFRKNRGVKRPHSTPASTLNKLGFSNIEFGADAAVARDRVLSDTHDIRTKGWQDAVGEEGAPEPLTLNKLGFSNIEFGADAAVAKDRVFSEHSDTDDTVDEDGLPVPPPRLSRCPLTIGKEGVPKPPPRLSKTDDEECAPDLDQPLRLSTTVGENDIVCPTSPPQVLMEIAAAKTVGSDETDHTLLLSIDVLIAIFMHFTSWVDDSDADPHDTYTLMMAIPNVCRRWRDVCQQDLSAIVLDFHWVTRCRQYHFGAVSSFTKTYLLTDNSLLAIANRFHAIGGIYLARCNHITEAGLLQLLQSCPVLLSLDLSDCCHAVTDNVLIMIATYCPMLTLISLSSCKNITDVGFRHLITGCTNLTSINVGGCSNLSDDAFAQFDSPVCPPLKRLTSLNVSGCVDIADHALHNIAIGAPNLVMLQLRHCFNITDTGIAILGMGLVANLSVIDLCYCKIGDDGLILLVQGCPQLTTINVANCRDVGDESLFALANACANLRRVILRDNGITTVGLRIFGNTCKNLSYVEVGNCARVRVRPSLLRSFKKDVLCVYNNGF